MTPALLCWVTCSVTQTPLFSVLHPLAPIPLPRSLTLTLTVTPTATQLNVSGLAGANSTVSWFNQNNVTGYTYRQALLAQV